MLRTLPLRILLTSALILDLTVNPMVLSAQEAPADIPTITLRSSTKLVLVDVVVTNKQGQPVAGLKAENFTVEENGKKQKVSVFVAPGTQSGVKPTPTPAGILSNHPEHVGPSAGVPTVLLLDACNSPFKDQAYARSQMLKYVWNRDKTDTSWQYSL
jgi:VWFA-related protein